MALPDLRAGVYRHYKGKLYLVLGYGRLSDIDEDRAVVVYIGLELSDASEGPRLQVRSAEGFWNYVTTDGEVADQMRAGVPRFTYVGPVWERHEHGR